MSNSSNGLPRVSVIIPTYRERDNIPLVISRLSVLLEKFDWEIVFVDDDSDDGTGEVLLKAAREHPRVRFIRRIGRRGLASACLEGMGSSAAQYFAVMDADLQHDETILPQMLATLAEDPNTDIAVGTRYSGSGGVGSWSKRRQLVSKFATSIEKCLLRTPLSDPMSGFFTMRRAVYDETAHRMTGKGFKILLDIMLSSPRMLKIREFPYHFRTRMHGESKLDMVVALEYLYLLADKTVGRIFPVGFVFYVLSGLTGLLLHLCILGILFHWAGFPFVTAQILATCTAMVSNFMVNNAVTFRSMKLKGPLLIPGLIAYILICGLGAIVNVQTADYLFQNSIVWWFAGTSGALIGAIWNYAVSTQIVWTWLPVALMQKTSRVPI